MNVVRLSLAYLRQRALTSLLNILLLALGIATIVFLVVVEKQFDGKLARDAAGIDLVVGAKGSPLQLILSAVYHVDVPQGNIPLAAVDTVAKAQFVRHAVPVALGDSFHGFRIVGTTPQYLDIYAGKVAQGRGFLNPMEAVIGAEVHQKTHLNPGDSFAGTHGLSMQGSAHEESYKIVGTLAPTGTVLDRLVVTSLNSVWDLHPAAQPGAREVTAILVQYSSPIGAVMLPQLLNQNPTLQAVTPASELVRVLSLVGVGLDVMRAFGVMLLISAALSTFVALYNSLQQREYDLAVLRSLGATRVRLVKQLVTEAMLISGAGAVAGVLLGHAFVPLARTFIDQRGELGITGLTFYPAELGVVALALASGVVAALIPTLKVYRLNVSRILARG